MEEKKSVKREGRTRRVHITMDVYEIPGLHDALRAFVVEHDLGKQQEELMHEAIEQGALLDGIMSGRADIHYE